MASSHANTHSEPAKTEQIITEFFAKSLHIILESRSPYVSSRNYSGEQVFSSPSSSSSSSSFRPRDKWFNLALRDCPAAFENIDFWRQSNLEPMIVDVILMQRPSNWDPLNFSPNKVLSRNLSGKERLYYGSDSDEFKGEAKSEEIVERWLLQYESKKTGGNGSGSFGSKRSSSTSPHALYKKSILALRSLYATVRLLPAYKLFRDLISSAQLRSYNLSHRVSSFVEPFTRREEADMQHFVFTPIETSCGRICLSVMYRPSVSDVNSEPSTPMSPQFIPEYVGSPLAERLKRFTYGPVSQSSPSSSPFGRRHSWSYDFYRASSPSVNPSPSPTFSESNAAISRHRSNHLPPASLPRHLHDVTPTVHTKNQSYDEYWPSPAFSPSPSPSPPTYGYIHGSHVSKVLSRCDSAPVSIPTSRLSSVPLLLNNQIMPALPPVIAGRSIVSERDTHVGQRQTSMPVDKLFLFSKDEPGKVSFVRPSSNSSPSKSFSRSSSRLSFQDDYDDSEFSGAFFVDDDDVMDPCFRHGSVDVPVGALVHMLKKAPPLRQDASVTTHCLQGSKLHNYIHQQQQQDNSNEISGEAETGKHSLSVSSSSGVISSKTTADALEELREYRAMTKELLLKQGKVPPGK